MKNLQYLRPETLHEALSMLRQYGAGAVPLIGGTDLMVRIQKGHINPAAVIDLKRVKDISDSIRFGADKVTIGARNVLSDLIQNHQIQHRFPALVDAALTVGSIQIRNRATLIGNICNASPAADTVPALIVYRASVTIAGKNGTRTVPLRDFIRGPGKTIRGALELAVSVEFPIPSSPFGAAFGRLTRRRGVDLATINMACGIDEGGVTTFVFGAVGPAPIVAADESGALADPGLLDSQIDSVLKSLIKGTSPISDVRAGKEYREAMLLTIGRRVLHQARDRYFSQS